MIKTHLGILVILLLAGQTADAIDFNEMGGDATDVPPGQNVVDDTTRIVGNLPFDDDADVYSFRWGGGVLTMDAVGSAFDTQLHLFDIVGNGIGENDDSVAFGRISEISLNLTSGDYLIGMTSFNNDALDANGLPIFGVNNTFADLNGNSIQGPEGNGPLADWDDGGFADGDYFINFSSPVNAVPEPGTLALMGLGLVGLLLSKRRSTQ